MLRPMDLRFSEEQEAFRLEVRAWLEANAPCPLFGRTPLGSVDTAEGFEAHRGWERKMFEAGFSVVNWPERYGGRDVGVVEWLVFEEEYYRAAAPTRVGQNGIFLLAPTMFEFGTPFQKDRFLPPMASGDEIWCQGWSEPDAGSDLAGIRSTARRRNEGGGAGGPGRVGSPGRAGGPGRAGWVLNGQKTWCSRGAFADWMFGIFRSEEGSDRHRGLSYFLVPLDAPGVTVRPIAQIDGETGFAEIFLEDVEVGDDQVLGEVGDGWRVAMSTAGSERGMSLRSPARYTEAARRLVALYDRCAEEDPERAALVEPKVARAWMAAEAYRLHTYWTASRIQAGRTVGPEASVGKVHWSETDLAIHTAALELLGERGYWVRSPDEHGGSGDRDGGWLDGYLFSLAGTIYAGTNEIQRNVIAERVLGMPRG